MISLYSMLTFRLPLSPPHRHCPQLFRLRDDTEAKKKMKRRHKRMREKAEKDKEKRLKGAEAPGTAPIVSNTCRLYGRHQRAEGSISPPTHFYDTPLNARAHVLITALSPPSPLAIIPLA